MFLRTCSILLLLLSACATTEPQQHKPKQHNQIAIPWAAPLVTPKPVAPVLPAPVGMTPPIPVMVDPGAQTHQEPEANPTPERAGSNRRDPPAPVASEPRPECIPHIKPHRGGNDPHNQCADKVPQNGIPGFDALVNGKHFDALQIRAGILWEVKTDNFDTYPPDLQAIIIPKQARELLRERDLARACGFDFRVGVRSEAHKEALEEEARDLIGLVVVMDWC